MQTIKVGIKFGLEQPVAGVGVEHRSELLHLGSLVIRSVQISFPGAHFFVSGLQFRWQSQIY